MILRYLYVSALQLRLQRFRHDARRARAIQHRTLLSKIRRHESSDYGRDHGFRNMGSVNDFRRCQAVSGYEQFHPYIERVLHGDVGAMFAPGTRVLMFAMTSGTTGQPKRLPITTQLFREYKAGWRMWGAGAYGDHIDLLRKHTLQLTSDWQQYRAPSGVPCGQISGLAAMTRPRMSSVIFSLPPVLSQIHDPAARHYASLRFGLASKRVGMIITANPSTLVEFGQRMDREKGSLIRDIHDGTMSCDLAPETRQALARRILVRQPERARELDRIVEEHGELTPRLAWPAMSVLAVWTGGSVNVYLSQLPALYGNTAIRDHGLSASEGRMTIPLSDNTPAGLLDFYHHYFEFIPVEEHNSARPNILEGHELEIGQDYYILLTTSGGLYRYNIHDVVRCVGFEGQAPLVEFLNKGKYFSSLTGEKLSEHQAVRAVKSSFHELSMPVEAFTLAPVMEQQPRYVLLVEPRAHRGRGDELAHRVQVNLERVNEEYGSKCSSGRLLPVQVREVPPGTWNALRTRHIGARGNFEEYKHPCLVNDLDFVDRVASLSVPAAVEVAERGRKPMSTTLLVTGATGMVGSHVVRRAVERGYEVQAMVRRDSDRRALEGLPIHYIEADLAEPESLPQALKDAEIVVHTAAHVGDWGPADKYRAINVIGLEHLIHATARSPRFRRWVQISSLGVYPPRHHFGTDESVPANPVGLDGYTRTKAEAESVLNHHIREHNFPAVILRPGIIYGPGDRHAIPRFVEKIKNGKMKFLGKGDRVINNTYIDNLVDAIFLAVENPDVVGETFNIRDERLVTREEFVNTIADYLKKPHPRHVPEWVARTLVKPIEGFARLRGAKKPPLLTAAQIKFMTLNLDYSIGKAKRMLGYQPQVDFHEGIRIALDDLTQKTLAGKTKAAPQLAAASS